jgi:hypothetical protein
MKEDKTIARLFGGGELSLNPNIRGYSLLSDATGTNEAFEEPNLRLVAFHVVVG